MGYSGLAVLLYSYFLIMGLVVRFLRGRQIYHNIKKQEQHLKKVEARIDVLREKASCIKFLLLSIVKGE